MKVRKTMLKFTIDNIDREQRDILSDKIFKYHENNNCFTDKVFNARYINSSIIITIERDTYFKNKNLYSI